MDWLDTFALYTSNLATVPIFQRWAGISILASAMERRVWMTTAMGVLYPNLYILLVGAASSGKTQIITPVRQLLRAIAVEGHMDYSGISLAPDNCTKAGFMDELKDTTNKQMVGKGADEHYLEWASLSVVSSEFVNFMPDYSPEFLGIMTDIYDCPAEYIERRRHNKEKIVRIQNPQINFISACTPTGLGQLFPESAWDTGITSRLIMIYSPQELVVVPFAFDSIDRKSLEQALVARLRELSVHYGPMEVPPEIQAEFDRLAVARHPPQPTHNRLHTYNQRRGTQLLKLSMVSAASRSSLVIELCDVYRALEWLLEAEAEMPGIFEKMVEVSDYQATQELYKVCHVRHIANGKPLRHSFLSSYLLKKRIKSRDIDNIISTMVSSGMLRRTIAGDEILYTPTGELK